jgi:hypothetical protein
MARLEEDITLDLPAGIQGFPGAVTVPSIGRLFIHRDADRDRSGK